MQQQRAFHVADIIDSEAGTVDLGAFGHISDFGEY